MLSKTLGFLLAVFTLTPLHAAPDAVTLGAPQTPGTLGAPQTPVLLELFTSEGCSSCPPADELFTKLAAEPGVIALAYHVDYWNKLGWTDPFSSPEWSRRQGRYAAAFSSENIYTPQLVAAGRVECVGSDEPRVRATIAAARKAPRPVRVTLVLGPPAAGKLPVTVKSDISGDLESKNLSVLVALFEDELVSDVKAGENAGQRMTHQRVVRRLLDAPHSAEVRFDLPLDSGWKLPQLGVAAFVQNAQLRVLGAAQARPK